MKLQVHVVGIVLALAGCAHHLPPVQRPYLEPTPQVLLESLRVRAEKLSALQADARAEQSGPGHPRVKVKVSAWLQRPDKLRLEIEGPLGTGAATLVSDGTHFSLMDASTARLYTGAAVGCNIARLVQVELEPAQIVAVLAGGVPIEAGPAALSWDPHDGGRELVAIRTGDGGTERVWLSGEANVWDPVKAERSDGRGKLIWRVEHDGFEDVEGRRLPGHTRVRDARRRAEIKLTWKDRTVDPELRQEGFVIQPAAGIPALPVTCN